MGGIIGVGRISEDGATDGHDHSTVSADDFGESGFLAAFDESGEQFFVAAAMQIMCPQKRNSAHGSAGNKLNGDEARAGNSGSRRKSAGSLGGKLLAAKDR